MIPLRLALASAVVSGMFAFVGCRAIEQTHAPHTPQPVLVVPPQSNVPRELAKVAMPRYVIEPPDLLSIDAVRAVPKPPYRLQPLDTVLVEATGLLPDLPISGAYTISPDGLINFGIEYGTVRLTGRTIDEANQELQRYFATKFQEPRVYLTLAEFGGIQQIAGQHLVGPDGTVTLGLYGSVFVAGKNLTEAKLAIEAHLSQYLENPVVAVDVFGFNSKVYYIVTQGAGLGDNVARLPFTGNETVLDAISYVNGLQSVSSKKIWIARPTPGCEQNVILPVDWCAITGRGSAATNYQLMPGDRVFIAEDKIVAFDNGLAKVLAPVERVLGITILGTSATKGIKFFNDPNAGQGSGF